MSYPLPALSHACYPFYTPSGEDKRWLGTGGLEEGGLQWVGGLMCVFSFSIQRYWIGAVFRLPSFVVVLSLRFGADMKPLDRITAQLLGPRTKETISEFPLQDSDLVEGPNRSQYASFTWADLAAVAPWLEIPKKIDGPGLGND